MKKLSFIVGAVTLAASGASFAGGPDQTIQAPQSNAGFYVGAGAAAAIPSLGGVINSHSTGLNVGAHAGYRFDNNIRLEGAFDYAGYDNNNVQFYTVMANAYYDFQLTPVVVPFVGAGIGWTHIRLIDNTEFSQSASDNEFAYQGIAGVGFNINKNLRANVTYKFRSYTNNSGLHQNIIGASLDYYLSS